MTTNLSLDQINLQVKQANKSDINIHISHSVGTRVEFLDVLVENNNGQLKTSAFHKPAAEPYLLPFLSDHPRHIHRNTIKAKLLRVVRLCSHVEDFDQERINIELTLLLNGYPPKFIAYHLKRFFEQNKITALMEQLDDNVYRSLHQQLLSKLTRKEKEHEKRQQKSMVPVTNHQATPIKSELHVHFTFESGPMSSFKRELKSLWEKHYVQKNPQMQKIQLKISTRSNRNLQQFFVNKKSPKAMLINIVPTNALTTA